MSNNRDSLSPVSRAVIAGALVGTTASCVEQWRHYQNGEKTLHQTAATVVCNAAKGGLVGGAVMAVADATAGRPVLTLLTLLSAGAAGIYLMDAIAKKDVDNETA
ncbi:MULTISPECIES: hypothetical protein [unclassified Brenneria]|uniref:hypothetical protein n=1 Tax=unclassified Brenneria TaxID=2634434 RepID=UPI0029C5F501|nr:MULTISPECIES: hypothetical protein [unclassified Brenneria]MDX5629648.1 hypothetical protein [Brenneria sp. L3-3Z]MDX5696794.1 hypothetical protein [Brenneria sp. L4-2C]MEE3663200.1 hypothetical protein [Brenneria sp. g21c3]